jgi:hypothetical protein
MTIDQSVAQPVPEDQLWFFLKVFAWHSTTQLKAHKYL